MKKSNATITAALSAAAQDIVKTAQALGVGIPWLLATKMRRGL